ncbi:hypothetical protein R3W88_019384 [Solanum pinnatisectum]|uniref:Ubiquitin-like protease family profile domain-containing protein n=1 Tax=Solanum pinnatisectum TaxID=50273 RepID=A0AAV9KK59_9SOLN|nr:hypothetical protein R3W88_019384 [Solanum pinnatisectum]
MISLILLCTDYYGKREDIDWNTNVHFANTIFGEPLTFEKRDNIPHQIVESNQCGIYTCAFAEYVCQGDLNTLNSFFYSKNLQLRYGVLLWDYGKRKIDTDIVSERESNAKDRQLSQKRN